MKRLKKYLLFLPLIILCNINLQSQLIYYQDLFHGGATGAGFSACLGSGAAVVPIYIEPGSIIKKAVLFSYRIGATTEDETFTFNGTPVTFSELNRISDILNNGNTPDAPNFSIHAIEVTNLVTPGDTSYTIEIPDPTPPIACINCRFNSAFLIILYENIAMPSTNVAIICNDKDNAANVQYNVSNLNSILNLNDVGLSIYSDRLGDVDIWPYAGSYLYLNTYTLGLLGGPDSINYYNGCGTKGHFYYQYNQLYGLDDDTPDSIMHRTDGLANIRGYINNNETYISLITDYENPSSSNMWTDYFLTFQLAYTTPCDTFSAGVSGDTLLTCRGDSAQLLAWGGNKYQWKPATGLSCDTCPNPMARPDSSILYTCTIYNTDSCSKVLPVKVNVNPAPSFTLVTTPATCGASDGVIQFTNITHGTAPYAYSLNGSSQPNAAFTGLSPGSYAAVVTDSNGCISDSIYITLNDTLYVFASFTATPLSGTAPIAVNFTNTSYFNSQFIWNFGDGNTAATINAQHTYTQGGSYTVSLIAWENDSTCSDTAYATIDVSDGLIIPQLLTPNGDGKNDVWEITGLNLYPMAGVEVVNRWGNVVYSSVPYQNNWGGECTGDVCLGNGQLPAGTYFYYLYLEGKSNSTSEDIKTGFIEVQY